LSASITKIHTASDAAAYDPAIGQLRPIARAHDTGIACAHIEFAVGVAAERELFFEPIHRDLSLRLLSKGAEK
jgi:hypothetical protein